MMVPSYRVNITLALQLKGGKEKNEVTEPVNWTAVVQGRGNSNYHRPIDS